jgi:transcriptional regulator with XRE-family HTH domain
MNLTEQQDAAYPGIATTTQTSETGNARRQQLADFLRIRRGAIPPDSMRSGGSSRRRVSGLRREEVAEAAGISVAWYTWMEQARDLTLSRATLEGLALALQLDEQEKAHLYRLAGHAAPLELAKDAVLDTVRQAIASMEPNPTYALDSRWNVVAWNRAAAELFRFDEMKPSERNMVSLIFNNQRHRALFQNWQEVAQCTLAHFRADSVEHVNDEPWLQQIASLTQHSAEFRTWWAHHDVTWPHSVRKEVKHPVHGHCVYQTLDMEMRQPARLRIVTYMPEK